LHPQAACRGSRSGFAYGGSRFCATEPVASTFAGVIIVRICLPGGAVHHFGPEFPVAGLQSTFQRRNLEFLTEAACDKRVPILYPAGTAKTG